ncbi:MAG: hypothetical protein DRJ97_04765 [Thermoprotei archaeon]|nr:MAG: hypothetical protein DRJ97_04765 [Thermoprotei archaeon]
MLRQAVILCGGRGVRLRPLTDEVPKVMVKVAGKPVVEYIVEKLERLGVEEIALVVSYKKEAIREYFGPRVKYCEQSSPKGTADALYAARNFVNSDRFAAIHGDLFFTDNLSWMVDEQPTMVSVYRVEDASQYGVVEVEGNLVVDIKEKSHAGPGLINAGIYLFDPSIFDAIEHTQLSARGEYELTDSIKLLIRRGVKVKARPLRGYWRDIGRLSDLREVEAYLASKPK